MVKYTLKKNNIRIYSTNKTVFDQNTNTSFPKKLLTYFGSKIDFSAVKRMKGFKLTNEMELQRFIPHLPETLVLTFSEIDRLGLRIIAIPVQSVEIYVLVLKEKSLSHNVILLTEIPKGHKIMYDPIEKCIKCIGDYWQPDFKDWFYLENLED